MAKPKHEYIYGINPCFEVVRSGKRSVKEAYLNETAANNPRLKKLSHFLKSREIPIERVDKHRLFQLSTSTEHQGAVLKASPYAYVSFDDLPKSERLILLDNVEDPHNIGAILRSAEIFGFRSVLLPIKGSPDVYPSVVKVSAGASEYLNITKECTASTYVRKAKALGYTVIALDGEGDVDLNTLENEAMEKVLLVVGGEGKSVSKSILSAADRVVRIEQKGKINSLNASIAAGIAMFVLRFSPQG
ncbi:MAG: 23S rRNA (guanosine(2251)-2'-O)-methyltransferase RlmB [Candidatus Latescibacterota bacterium]